MKMGTYLVLLFLITSCTETAPKVTSTDKSAEYVSDEIDGSTALSASEKPIKKNKKLHLDKNFEMVSLTEVELIPAPDDSISYHVNYQLEPDLFVAVAQPNQETFEGVRLQLIREKKNKKMKLLDESSPGYDSPQLFPTFFKNEYGEYIIIANMGASDSWGAKVYSLVDNQFTDMGYVDMAIVEKREFPDSNGKMNKYANISKFTSINSSNDQLVFSFSGDKMILFEDNNEQRDVKFKAGEFDYIYDNKSWILRKN